MREKISQGVLPVTDATTIVKQAASWAQFLTRTEVRGPGDLENAWHRLARRYGVPWRAFWTLRYRRPKDIAASVYQQLQNAYKAECARQLRALQHEIEITEALAGPDDPSVVAAKALVDEND